MGVLQKNALWNASGNLVYLGLQWLIMLFVVRTGGYTDAGYLSLAMSLTGTFQNVAHFGVRNYQVSDIADKYQTKDYISMRLITCLSALFLCMGFCFLNSYRGVQNASIVCFMLFRVIESFCDVLHGIDQKNERLDIAGKSFLFRGIAGFVTFCGVYLGTKNLWMGLLAMFLSSLGVLLIYDISQAGQFGDLKPDVKINRIKPLIKECFPIFISMLLSAALTTIPRLYLEKMLGAEVLGIYSAVFAPAMLIQAGAVYLYMPLISIFAVYYDRDKKSYTRLFWKVTAVMGGCSAGILIAGRLFGSQVLRLLIGAKIAGYEYLLEGVLLCTILTALASFLGALLTVRRCFQALVISNVAAVIFCIASSQVFIKMQGVKGTSSALISSMLVLILLTAVLSRKEFGGRKWNKKR